MKKINLLILISVLSAFKLVSQDFEGYILYSYQFLDSLGNDITEKMGTERGLEQNYYINSLNYKGIDEKGQISQLYNSKTNIYFYQQGSKIKSFSGATEYPKDFKFEMLDDTLTIEGYLCKSMVATSESGQTIYYFNDSISIDKSNFVNHRFGNWSKYLDAANGSLPLKFIVKKKEFTWIALATKIEFRQLNDDEFNIEKLLGIKK